jgi:hypothetical protein
VITSKAKRTPHIAIRFHLMRHDETEGNHAYLYDHSTIVATYGEGRDAVDIVQTVGSSDKDQQEAEKVADYLANYQHARLASGLEKRGTKIMGTYGEAVQHAGETYDLLTRSHI